MFPKKLNQKLEVRKASNALRKLGAQDDLVDFSSNDYLGLSKNEIIFDNAHKFLIENNIKQNGATGSRLLSGNHKLYNQAEQQLCEFHNSPSSIIFNSGYDANIGFFSSVPQRGDIILYDEFIHASIRDGIKMSHAKAYKFNHNDLDDLEKRCQMERNRSPRDSEIYVVTESVFSMDGDTPNLLALVQISKKYQARLIVDEAHAIGLFGENGSGIIQDLKLENDIFARIVTFGKAMGCHGAAVLGSHALKSYLINFSRSFIYTTGLPPHSLATINCAYNELLKSDSKSRLLKNIRHFKSEIVNNKLEHIFIESNSAIHCCVISGNTKVKSIAEKLQHNGFNVKPILSPTVPKDKERLRFCLHSYNSLREITQVLNLLATFVRF
ncbi:aminotransferase class I/II-fold pyridoxal phosphate-dependent enzyme [Cognatitamlana onchidii]|uniref:aminotransferase class I/II-fold pyridoxal phosphate-dependent enzyme n=1 Tax=Cognatitamlana onchidii TaxID=2562860 RepID=UPI0010A5F4AF|nr:pyridoxal phosphate-dependent aminotransferase family protein [Algibacter onchidii]